MQVRNQDANCPGCSLAYVGMVHIQCIGNIDSLNSAIPFRLHQYRDNVSNNLSM